MTTTADLLDGLVALRAEHSLVRGDHADLAEQDVTSPPARTRQSRPPCLRHTTGTQRQGCAVGNRHDRNHALP